MGEIAGGEKIGFLAADVMESIEKATPPDGHSPSIGVVAIVVEINTEEEDGPGMTDVIYRCSDQRRWVQAGFFKRAGDAVYSPMPALDEEEDE